MNRVERTICIDRISSGCMIVNVEKKDYVLRKPEPFHRVLAGALYTQSCENALEEGILSEEKMTEKMIEMDTWSKLENERLKNVPDLLEEAKLQLYLAYKNFRKRDIHEKRIASLNKEFMKLFIKKESLLERCAERFAKARMDKFLICCNVHDVEGNKCWSHEECFEQSYSLINAICQKYSKIHISETEARSLVQQEPWRSLWGAGKSEGGVFGNSSSNLTDEQKTLVTWSRIYDSVRESSESPTEEVLKNNDMLDGWFVYQSKQQEKEKKNRGQDKTSDVRGDEVYMFADTPQDAARVYEMNDDSSRAILRQRQKQLEKSPDGLRAQDTFDAKMDMRQMSNEKFKSKFKN